MEGADARQALAEDHLRTTPRPQLARDPRFAEISPGVGRIDEDAYAQLVGEDPDHAVAMLAEMRSATDRELAAIAARLASRLVLDIARVGPTRTRGIARMVSSPAGRFEGDLDLDRSLDALVQARASSYPVGELYVRHWTRPATALALVVDRSGSMSGSRLATAGVAAAACAHRAPSDWSVLAFADRVIVVKAQDDSRSSAAVVDDLLRLRGRGTTDLAAAVAAAMDQLDRSKAKRRVVVLMSDCRATTGADAVQAACQLDDLCILAPSDDAADARDFARRCGARIAEIDSPGSIPAAICEVLDSGK